ncbi:bifunctional 2-C-methyl-D-erythritol 4-phosphate cytidylyltransferase/2-C-methyl-D-erythritol 2,4-cyclodiphosphate synthase [Aurantimonas sp. VKM B-3413]|uniref:bifunctional 2-C-methyl-D-erythritol 4-phosphate cytidylyltransferase/2-C-methyl-D-erythritol 2,4-cyclodiphosphate synthase n=1 Tax=Aurantimonas sp. VKM B-3413 TaxID=2779401 RepID=UPI001E3CC2BA|nr:bifunctional 2-C-methyl-D-erythritol 4-phosphate cytidylyltransferase/2-C-methyl-D-erythritol 2,4-cyclodiphosphate synthase [Aurantimonas sp. VKM B-3413]MCB8838531.1 bifunctional 2-C-methyl-D-erythritol 4-phosphate cytidylyltransferase/2-C-methyl-D-erythritol 2,4-cyclodiphosphate synthase [Aurantimonas sp. VKM B-3413]
MQSRVAAIIVAAGRGERAGQSQEGPKQYRRIGGRAVLAHTVATFRAHDAIDEIVLVVHPDDHALLAAALGPLIEGVTVVDGGRERQESVRLGLQALAGSPPESVLIHDGVRPFADTALIDAVIAAVSAEAGAIPSLAVADTLKRSGPEGVVTETLDRSGLYAAQTPQGFPFRKIREAHEAASVSGRSGFTDDASIAEWAGIPVRLVEGAPDNVKLTTARDIALADRKLRGDRAMIDVRTGNGYDVHRLVAGNHVTLCGVRIAHDQTLDGHSDADVGLHALTDALLATCGAGDIGDHFPPSDPQWKGAASHIFVQKAVAIIRDHGGRIMNADISLICEAPKIAPHREAMCEAIAAMTGLSRDRVSVKATTNETIGFVGRKEGIAAIATASVAYGESR